MNPVDSLLCLWNDVASTVSFRLPDRETAGLSVASTRASGRDQTSLQRHVSRTPWYRRPGIAVRYRYDLGRETRRPSGGVEGDIIPAVGKKLSYLKKHDFTLFLFISGAYCYGTLQTFHSCFQLRIWWKWVTWNGYCYLWGQIMNIVRILLRWNPALWTIAKSIFYL